MDPYSTDCENNNNLNRDISIILAVLESGNSIELPASGYSMFPTLKPGYRVVVKPLPPGELPEPGMVVVYRDSDILRMHRLIKITRDNSGNPHFISRGDSLLENDKLWTMQQFLGVALTYNNGKRVHSIKVFVLPAWRYKLNYRLVWAVGIARKMVKRHKGVKAKGRKGESR